MSGLPLRMTDAPLVIPAHTGLSLLVEFARRLFTSGLPLRMTDAPLAIPAHTSLSLCSHFAELARRLIRIETVAETSHRADQLWFGGFRFQFFAQPQDVNIHAAVYDGAIVSPNRVKQLVAAENNTGTAHQK